MPFLAVYIPTYLATFIPTCHLLYIPFLQSTAWLSTHPLTYRQKHLPSCVQTEGAEDPAERERSLLSSS
jgi:hypothetical protein